MNGYITNLQNAVNHIETNLNRTLKIAQIAKVAGLSTWHFQRMFRAITGDSVHKYVHGRRMTVAAESLLNPDQSIIDLALDLQFEGQESFTRAFKRYHHCTPGQYRKKKGLSPKSVKKIRITKEYLEQILKGSTMKPQIQEIEEVVVIGLKAKFNGAMAENANNHEIIPDLWKNFYKRMDEIKNREGQETYGVIMIDPDKPADQKENLHENLIYLAGVKVSSSAKIPKGMSTYTIPKAKYGIFEHAGPVKNIDQTLNYIFGTWLPQSKFKTPDRANFERFPANYDPQSEKAKMEFCLPLI